MRISFRNLVLTAFSLTGLFQAGVVLAGSFERQWMHVSETSAVIYWQLGDISTSANSYLEYGKTESLGSRTEESRKPRWSHLHRLKGLETGSKYYYRMVVVDTLSSARAESEILSFTPEVKVDAVRLPQAVSGPPYILDQPDTYYLLTQDVTTDGDAFRIAADGVTLDLDGHTVIFGNNTNDQVFGVRFINQGEGILCNGHIVQGEKSGDYSCAVRSNSRPFPTEIYGITTDVHLKCAYPVNFHSQANSVQIHHNHFYSRVTEIESRHYPGNALLRMYISGGNIQIHDNLLTEGCHRAILLVNESNNVEVYNNDIQHHQQYVNGYAIAPPPGADIHHNRITSTGRGAHLTKDGISFHDNYLDLKGHQHLDDMPQGSRPWHHRLVELHGIKLEGNDAANCKVYDNFVRIIQRLPNDSEGLGEPEDKADNGVYLRSTASSLLVDNTQNWEANRWRYYYVRYSPDLPPAYITQSTANSLIAGFEAAAPGEYTIYMKWQYVPPTPLNIACYDPDAMNEVYHNTFIAFTEYDDNDIWHGGYGNTGNWASTIMFIGMDRGPASSGKYSIDVHDNDFISNDLFLNSSTEVNMTVRIENNSFKLAGAPHSTDRDNRIRAVGAALENAVINTGGNQFTLDEPGRNMDFNGDGTISIVDVICLLLLGRAEPDNPLADWNGDGKYFVSDAISLLLDILGAKQGTLLTAAAAGKKDRDEGGMMTSAEFSGLLKQGNDGL
ncbi:hypothetical protein ACFL5K_03130 [Gemmatimonadota bacterium]